MQSQRYATSKFYFAQAMQAAPQSRTLDYMMANLVETRRWQDAVDLYLAHKTMLLQTSFD